MKGRQAMCCLRRFHCFPLKQAPSSELELQAKCLPQEHLGGAAHRAPGQLWDCFCNLFSKALRWLSRAAASSDEGCVQVVSLPPLCRYQAVKRGNRGSVIGVGLEVGFDQDKGQSSELQVRLPLHAHTQDSAAYFLQAQQ